jgi:hypothetical protein
MYSNGVRIGAVCTSFIIYLGAYQSALHPVKRSRHERKLACSVKGQLQGANLVASKGILGEGRAPLRFKQSLNGCGCLIPLSCGDSVFEPVFSLGSHDAQGGCVFFFHKASYHHWPVA